MSSAAACAVAVLIFTLPAAGKFVRGNPVAPAKGSSSGTLPFALSEVLSNRTTPFSEPRPKARQEAPPNIVFILSDDLGYGDYTISPGAHHPRAQIPTPNIQRLADNGMKFLRGYSGPVCAPSRCTLMTGRHMGRCTIRGNDGSFTPLLPADVTVAEVLRDTHVTGIVGKWGLGDFGTTGYPTEQGFDYYVGQDSQVACHDWFPQFINNNTKQYQPLNDKRLLGPGCLAEGGGNCVWANDLVRDEAVAFIKRHANGPKPFFLYVSSTTPHDGQLWNYPAEGYPVPMPYTAASFIKPHWNVHLRNFAAAVWAQDLIVGAVLDELAAQSIEENTIVFFSGDNGPDMHDLHLFDDVGPFRGKKRSLHEGGVRQTVAVQWKGRIKPGTSSDHLFAFWDLLPTAADLAGVPKSMWPATEGVSAAALLQGSGEQKEHEYLYWEFCYYGRADGNLPQTYDEGWAQSLRLDDSGTEWKGIRVDRGPLQLWNLTADPAESHDLAMKAHMEPVVRRITRMMEEAHVENKHWPSVGEGGAGPRCCDSCYNPQGIGCEPQCVPTSVQDGGSALASDSQRQKLDSTALVGDWFTESGLAFKIDLTGTFATIQNVNDPDACWQEGTGVLDIDEARLTANVGPQHCQHHLIGSLSRTTEEVQFDEDYKYHNVTYHIDWVTREGKRWPQWSRSVGLEQAPKAVATSQHPLHAARRGGATSSTIPTQKIATEKRAHTKVVVARATHDVLTVDRKVLAAERKRERVHANDTVFEKTHVLAASKEKLAEKKFVKMASKGAAPEKKSGRAITWVSKAVDRLEQLEGKMQKKQLTKEENQTKVARADEDLKEAVEELAREALATTDGEVKNVKEEAHSPTLAERLSKVPSRWAQMAHRLRAKVGVVQLNAAIRSPASRI